MSNQPRSPLGRTEVHDLRSGAVGDVFRVFVAECGPAPAATLLVTDANGLFGLTVDTVRLLQLPALVPPLLVVGVGYPDASSLLDTVELRARDLTPTSTPVLARSGGADDFVRFLDDELRPWIIEQHPAAGEAMVYFGHSLGGLFGTYVLLTETEMFDRYVLASPSLWWDDGLAFRLEHARSESGDAIRSSVVFGIGSLETDDGRRLEAANLPDGHRFKPPTAHLDMVDDLRRFASRLASRNYEGLDLELVEVPDEFHVTVPGTVLSRALRHFYADRTEHRP